MIEKFPGKAQYCFFAGMLIFIAKTIINRWIVPIPDPITILLSLIVTAFFVASLVLIAKNAKK